MNLFQHRTTKKLYAISNFYVMMQVDDVWVSAYTCVSIESGQPELVNFSVDTFYECMVPVEVSKYDTDDGVFNVHQHYNNNKLYTVTGTITDENGDVSYSYVGITSLSAKTYTRTCEEFSQKLSTVRIVEVMPSSIPIGTLLHDIDTTLYG